MGQKKFDELVEREIKGNWLKDGETLEAAAEAYKSSAENEVIAQLCEAMLNKESAIKAFAKRNTAAAERIRDHIKSFLHMIRDAVKDAQEETDVSTLGDEYIHDMTGCLEKWSKAIDDAVKEQEQEKKQNAKARLDALTEKARTNKQDGVEHMMRQRPNIGSTITADDTQRKADIGQQATGSRMGDLTKAGTYSWENLTKQKPMRALSLPSIDSLYHDGKRNNDLIKEKGVQNAERIKVGNNEHGNPYVVNEYTGRPIVVDKKGIKHGLNGGIARKLTNSRLGVIAGELCKNGIPVNELKNENENAETTYALVGYAFDENLEMIGVLHIEANTNRVSSMQIYELDRMHSINGMTRKNTSRIINMPHLNAETSSNGTGVYISISNLLDVVKDLRPDIMSNDVLRHYGISERPAGYYNGIVNFSLRTEIGELTQQVAKMTDEQLNELYSLGKNKKGWYFKDLSRVLDTVAGENKELRDMLHDVIEAPHSRATGLYAKSYRKSVETFKKEMERLNVYDKKSGRYIQIYGEGHYQGECAVDIARVGADEFHVNAVKDGKTVLEGRFSYDNLIHYFSETNAERLLDALGESNAQIMPSLRGRWCRCCRGTHRSGRTKTRARNWRSC